VCVGGGGGGYLPAKTSEISTSLRVAACAKKASAATSADPSVPPKLFVLSLTCKTAAVITGGGGGGQED